MPTHIKYDSKPERRTVAAATHRNEWQIHALSQDGHFVHFKTGPHQVMQYHCTHGATVCNIPWDQNTIHK